MSSSTQIVAASIQSAVSQGQISADAAEQLIEPLDEVAASGAAGVAVDDIDAEEVTLISLVFDCSGSMSTFRDTVIEAHKKCFLDPLKKAKNADAILCQVWIFSDDPRQGEKCRLLHGYMPVPDCPELTPAQYDPDGGTPLWESIVRAMTGLVAYSQTLRDSGTRTKNILVVFSDGAENASDRKFTSPGIRQVVAALLKQENYVLSYCFFGDEKDAQRIAAEIGFPDHHRLTVGQNDSDIRRLFGQVSASVISASQSTVSASGLSQNTFFVTP